MVSSNIAVNTHKTMLPCPDDLRKGVAEMDGIILNVVGQQCKGTQNLEMRSKI